LLIVAAALAAVLGAAYVGLSLAFPPDRLAALLFRQLSAASGRDVSIDGQLSYRLLPRLAVVATDVALANPPGASRPRMLVVDRVALDLALWPLLQGRIELGTVAIDGVDLLLETDRTGRGNWQPTPGPGKATGAPPAPPGQPGDSDPVSQVQLAQLRLSNVRVRYLDARKAGEPLAFEVRQLEIDPDADAATLTGSFELGKQAWKASGRTGRLTRLLAGDADWPFDLQFSTDGARATAEGRWLPDKSAGTAAVSVAIERAAALTPWLVDSARVPLPIELTAGLTLDAQSLRADALALSIAEQKLSGKASVKLGARPIAVEAQLASNSIDMARLWHGAAGAGAARTASRTELFDDTPIAFGKLPPVDATVSLALQRLRWPGMPGLRALNTRVALRGGRLAIEPLAFKVADGRVSGSLVVVPLANNAARLQLDLDAAQLSVDALAQAAGNSGYTQGGRLQLRTRLQMSGATPRALAASADGEVLLQLADVTLSGKLSPDGPNLLARLLQTVTQQRDAVSHTRVQCAVVRLPLKAGVAAEDRSIAVETDQLNITASGEVDLRDQSLRLAFKPHVKQALSLNTAGLASLVLLKGPLLDPKFSLDAAGTVSLALNLGVAGATGGLSLLGERLFRQASDPQPCRYAATGQGGSATKSPPSPAAPGATPSTPEKSLPGLLRRIFK
jgi:uncharacterized protein involved in outer membrane biogenesis